MAPPAQHVLASTYAGGRIQDGVMFDVRTVLAAGDGSGASPAPGADSGLPPPDGITVRGLDLLTPRTTSLCVELYTREGSFRDAADDPSAWDFLGSFRLEGMGPDAPTVVPDGAFAPLPIGRGETRAFYVTTQDEALRYTKLEGGGTAGAAGGEADVLASSAAHFRATATDRRERGAGNRALLEEDGRDGDPDGEEAGGPGGGRAERVRAALRRPASDSRL